MKIRTSRGMLFVILVTLITACSGEEPIDQGYLESESYQQFKENQEQEYAQYIDDYQALKTFLSAFEECPLEKKWDYPIQIDDQLIHGERLVCKTVSQKFKTDFVAHSMGYSVFGDFTIRWIKVNKKTSYKDVELIAASYQNGSLISFKTVGIFQENLSKDISTRITVTDHDDYVSIYSLMSRGIKYPFEYDNVIESTFRMDAEGNFSEQIEKVEANQSLPTYLEALNKCDVGKKWTLPVEFKADVISELGTPCTQVSHEIVQSIGYTRFKKNMIRWFAGQSTTSTANILMAAIYRDGTLVNFQTIGVLWQSSSRGISATAKIYEEEKFVYILSSMVKTQDYPIQEEEKKIKRYRIDVQGDIKQL